MKSRKIITDLQQHGLGCIKGVGQFLLMGKDQECGNIIEAEVQSAVQG